MRAGAIKCANANGFCTGASRRVVAEPDARRCAAAGLPTAWGEFQLQIYCDPEGREHAVLSMGTVAGEGVLTRIHSECLTGDVFASLRCDCGEQLRTALAAIAKEGQGILIYLRQEGRSIGLAKKIRAYQLQEQGFDTVDANVELGEPKDARTYYVARDVLADLGTTSIRLLTNNPAKMDAMQSLGVNVVERIPIEIEPNAINREYMRTKREKMGHWLGQL